MSPVVHIPVGKVLVLLQIDHGANADSFVEPLDVIWRLRLGSTKQVGRYLQEKTRRGFTAAVAVWLEMLRATSSQRLLGLTQNDWVMHT